MSFAQSYMMELNNCNHITVLEGYGEFLEYKTGEIYEIHNIKLPFNSSGKHITVFSKDDVDIVQNREYFDGKILSFTCTKVYHW